MPPEAVNAPDAENLPHVCIRTIYVVTVSLRSSRRFAASLMRIALASSMLPLWAFGPDGRSRLRCLSRSSLSAWIDIVLAFGITASILIYLTGSATCRTESSCANAPYGGVCAERGVGFALKPHQGLRRKSEPHPQFFWNAMSFPASYSGDARRPCARAIARSRAV